MRIEIFGKYMLRSREARRKGKGSVVRYIVVHTLNEKIIFPKGFLLLTINEQIGSCFFLVSYTITHNSLNLLIFN